MILVFPHSVIHICVISSVSDCWTQVKKGEETFHQTSLFSCSVGSDSAEIYSVAETGSDIYWTCICIAGDGEVNAEEFMRMMRRTSYGY